MATGVIYLITNLVTGWCYVGSTLNEKQRLGRHLRHLRKKKHFNKALQADFDRDGEKNFQIEILHRDVPEKELHLFERSTIAVMDLENEGRVYNKSRTPRISPQSRAALARRRRNANGSELDCRSIAVQQEPGVGDSRRPVLPSSHSVQLYR
jgi:group I intron endonuclease